MIELLVVIAIIGLLGALMFPSLQRSREAANQVKCARHITQIASAGLTYAADHEGVLPPYRRENSSLMGQQILIREGYMGDYRFKGWGPYSHIKYSGYRCPSWGEIEGEPATYVQTGGYTINGGLSYTGRADWESLPPKSQHNYRPKTLFMVKDFATTVYWMESPAHGGQTFLKVPPVPGDNQSIHYRHNGGVNIGFCDGHVKWFSGEDLEAYRAQQLTGVYPGYPIVFNPAGPW